MVYRQFAQILILVPLLFASLPNTTNQLACHSVLAHAGRVHSFRQMVVGFEDCDIRSDELAC